MLIIIVAEARNSNMRHRPIGIGVQGLADTFILLRQAFESDEAKQLNKDIFETIYYAALTASKDLAIENGPYESYKGSPVSKGILQFDMWNVKPSERWEWDLLRDEIKKNGVRNSLLSALMPQLLLLKFLAIMNVLSLTLLIFILEEYYLESLLLLISIY